MLLLRDGVTDVCLLFLIELDAICRRDLNILGVGVDSFGVAATLTL
jgi:hypothetical protein